MQTKNIKKKEGVCVCVQMETVGSEQMRTGRSDGRPNRKAL